MYETFLMALVFSSDNGFVLGFFWMTLSVHTSFWKPWIPFHLSKLRACASAETDPGS
jgi:hypothetical protein